MRHEQNTLALVSIADALASAIDPTGTVMQRACDTLREGLALSDDMGHRDSEAAEIVRDFLQFLESP
jgi:hypothetical protein